MVVMVVVVVVMVMVMVVVQKKIPSKKGASAAHQTCVNMLLLSLSPSL